MVCEVVGDVGSLVIARSTAACRLNGSAASEAALGSEFSEVVVVDAVGVFSRLVVSWVKVDRSERARSDVYRSESYFRG